MYSYNACFLFKWSNDEMTVRAQQTWQDRKTDKRIWCKITPPLRYSISLFILFILQIHPLPRWPFLLSFFEPGQNPFIILLDILVRLPQLFPPFVRRYLCEDLVIEAVEAFLDLQAVRSVEQGRRVRREVGQEEELNQAGELALHRTMGPVMSETLASKGGKTTRKQDKKGSHLGVLALSSNLFHPRSIHRRPLLQHFYNLGIILEP